MLDNDLIMTDSGSQPVSDDKLWSRLTDRQRAVFDLLLDRKTSKEIARILDISKDTVDQRVTTARNALGAANRNEAVRTYARLRAIYDKIAYDPAVMAERPSLMPSDFPDDGSANDLLLSDSMGSAAQDKGSGLSFKDLGRHDHKASSRVWIYVTMIVVPIFLAMGGLAIAQALTVLVSR